ncbi:hypothetical protein OGH69_02855 [Flavobacterium sp. MFBS3-15]|uniref:hypothetical protein n=1 Tax=Flavobacterium sp. MFBS3-15 TaxID=2989816 RepID=UPI002235DE24|nr:hypothetical protein [Flavobacterium sp. MFBS3-15]MCW4467892.1 hypothetical protein [Flavobacterium sp. MFBS3-15]
MKRKLFLLVLPALFLMSCGDDDESGTIYTIPETSAPYNLVNVSGSIVGVSHDFEPRTITWKFNTDQTVTVVNNNTNEDAEDFFESGTYELSYQPAEYTPAPCEENLFIDNIDFGCVNATDSGLILTQAVADGYVLTFIK